LPWAGHAIPHSVDRVRGPSTSRGQTESSASYRAVCNLGDGIGIEHRGIYSFIDAHLARLRKFFGRKWHRPTTRSTSFSQLNEAFVERAFRRIAPSIIWTVLRSLSRVAPKRRRRCVSAGGRQETVRAGDPAPVIDPRNGEEGQAHILVTGHADCLKPFALLSRCAMSRHAPAMSFIGKMLHADYDQGGELAFNKVALDSSDSV
jgi:hypothetical protein